MAQSNSLLPSTLMVRFGRGVGSTAIGQVVAAVSSILLVPLFLRAWGAEGYGQWLSLTAFISYISLLDFGGQSFIGNLLAREYARGNQGEFQQKLSEGVSLFALIALIAFALLILVLCVPGFSLPGHDTPFRPTERLILLLMGTSYLLSIPTGVYVTVYRAAGYLARSVMIGNVFRFVALVCYSSILVMRLPATLYAVVHLSIGVVSTFFIVWDTHRLIPVCRGAKLSIAAALTARAHLGGSMHFWLLALASALNLQGVVLVLAANGSPETVATYSAHRTIAGLVGYMSNLVQGPLWPEFTFMHAQEDHAKLTNVSLLTIRMVVLLSGVAALGLWILLPTIYPIWTGRHLQFQAPLLALLLFQAVLAAGWTTSGWSLLATNNHYRLTYWALANALLTIGFAIVLAPKFGAMGAVSASLLGDVICGAAVYPGLAAGLHGMPVKEFYKAAFLPILALLIPSALIATASWVHNEQFMLLASILAVASLYPVARIALRKQDADWAVSKLQALIQSHT